MRAMLIALAMLLCAGAAQAGSLRLQLVGTDGKPVADAVVILRPAGHAAPPAHLPGPFMISQKDIQFHPFVTVVPVGADVSFPNLDPVKHHVYSFSPAKPFELKLYARDQTRSVHFDKPGIVAIGCNIHDSMSAYILVTDSLWTAKSDAAGHLVIASVPPGAYSMSIWHPYLRVPNNRIDQPLTMAATDHSDTLKLALRKPQMMDMSGY